MSVGMRIRERRLALGLSQDELAHRMGYRSRNAVSNVETEKEDLTTARVSKYAAALGCTESYLMGWTDAPEGYGGRVESTLTVSARDDTPLFSLLNFINTLNEQEQAEALALLQGFHAASADVKDIMISAANRAIAQEKGLSYSADVENAATSEKLIA